MKLDLALVMPVYNEEACVADVVREWREMLSGLDLRFRLLVLNDGSRDGTAQALSVFAKDPHIEVINKPNSGHGPTVLLGYHRAVELAEWVFQCDSDDEMKAHYFPLLWEKRAHYDALFATRTGRTQHFDRRLISAFSRFTVRALFGPGIEDVNVPYRLIRADLLREIIAQIPDDTFAPNVIISGALARAHRPIYNHPVPHEGRKTGQVSITNWKLWRAAARSFARTITCRPTLGKTVNQESAR